MSPKTFLHTAFEKALFSIFTLFTAFNKGGLILQSIYFYWDKESGVDVLHTWAREDKWITKFQDSQPKLPLYSMGSSVAEAKPHHPSAGPQGGSQVLSSGGTYLPPQAKGSLGLNVMFRVKMNL